MGRSLPARQMHATSPQLNLAQCSLAFARLLALGSIVAMHSSMGWARVIQVGPQESVKTIAEAARLAKDDDVVEIASGNYPGDVATWTQKRLTIRGIGERPVLLAAGKSAGGKAIWVVRNGDFTVSNIEFRGARVKDGNGAGIRFERGKLRVVNCAFFDNQMGILTANYRDAELTIEDSIFGTAPKQKKPLTHLLYAGRIELLRVTGSRFHGGYYGHLLKSRARISDIRYNLLVDAEGGMASYEAEFPNGGDVTLVGNVIAQSSTTENQTLVAYGAEGGGVWPTNRLRLVHNTLHSEGWRPAWFLRVFASKFESAPQVMTSNNLLVGIGLFTTGVEGQHLGNHFTRESMLGDPFILNYELNANSDLRDTVNAINPDPDDLQPKFEQRIPGNITAVKGLSKWSPGAVQSSANATP